MIRQALHRLTKRRPRAILTLFLSYFISYHQSHCFCKKFSSLVHMEKWSEGLVQGKCSAWSVVFPSWGKELGSRCHILASFCTVISFLPLDSSHIFFLPLTHSSKLISLSFFLNHFLSITTEESCNTNDNHLR